MADLVEHPLSALGTDQGSRLQQRAQAQGHVCQPRCMGLGVRCQHPAQYILTHSGDPAMQAARLAECVKVCAGNRFWPVGPCSILAKQTLVLTDTIDSPAGIWVMTAYRLQQAADRCEDRGQIAGQAQIRQLEGVAHFNDQRRNIHSSITPANLLRPLPRDPYPTLRGKRSHSMRLHALHKTGQARIDLTNVSAPRLPAFDSPVLEARNMRLLKNKEK